MKTKVLLVFVLSGLIIIGCQTDMNDNESSDNNYSYEEVLSKYNTEIPENILTPDRVESRIGTLEFYDGIPTKKTAELVYDNLDFLRGIETFLNGIPAASLEAFRIGQEKIGAGNSNQVMIFDQLMDSKSLFLTGNASTVYVSTFLNLKKDGATVI
jgi:hypothetical protein